MKYTDLDDSTKMKFSKLENGDIFTFCENYNEGYLGFKKDVPYLFLDKGGDFNDDFIYNLRTNILMKVRCDARLYLQVRKLKYKLKISI